VALDMDIEGGYASSDVSVRATMTYMLRCLRISENLIKSFVTLPVCSNSLKSGSFPFLNVALASWQVGKVPASPTTCNLQMSRT
jgi:hypothetical protein